MPTGKHITMLALALLAHASPVAAREFDMSDWTNVNGFSIWKTMNNDEQENVVRDFIGKNPQAATFGDDYVKKVQHCLTKEVNDTEYKDVKVPLLVPLSYCFGKYMAIFSQKKG